MLFFVSKYGIGNFSDDNTLSSFGKILGEILYILKYIVNIEILKYSQVWYREYFEMVML